MIDSGPNIALIVLGGYNLIQNLVLGERGYVPGNVAVTCALVGYARRQGCTWEEIGLEPRRAAAGLRHGLAGVASAAAISAVAHGHPAIRRFLLDQRAAVRQPRELFQRVMLRFPLGTALFEEVAFRGVVYALLRAAGRSKASAAMSTALAFALWHIIPARHALKGNPLESSLRSRWSRSAAVVMGITATGLASIALTWLRERSGSLTAPWMTHAGYNTSFYLAGVLAWHRAAKSHKSSPAHSDV